MAALYLHVPFCAKVCPYCGFATTPLPSGKTSERLVRRWLRGLELDAESAAEGPLGEVPWGKTAFSTFYFGGGTPSILDGESLGEAVRLLRSSFRLEPAEATIEANPESLDAEKCRLWRELGFTRLSLGVQSLDDAVLRAAGRNHDRAGALRALETALGSGLSVTADLMFALPGQGAESFLSSLRELLGTGVPHVSFYGLGIEEKTPFAQRAARGEIGIDEDLYAECYARGAELCARSGLERYELSNFAKPGFESRHNSAYWRGDPYLGLGPGAHGYDGANLRYANHRFLSRWADGLERGEPARELDPLGPRERLEERLWLGLRLAEGADLAELRAFDADGAFFSGLDARLEPWLKRGAVRRDGDRLRLRDSGWLLLDEIAAALLP
ncbi:MAG: radical SAM family heme chaperone HemW [Fibrobacterales bacterium]|nr:radical SAM family heme chaperone HemW [Fibrobacterales bacterium]